MAGAIAPGSALSCLDEIAGETVAARCEKAVFASPEAVAADINYVMSQLALLNDGTRYAERGDASYAAELAPLRTALELQRVSRPKKKRSSALRRRSDALPSAAPCVFCSHAHMVSAGMSLADDPHP
jgi:hypothetical protein